MRKSRFTEEQMIGAIKESDSGGKTTEICRRLGITTHTFYRWKSKYGGLEVNEARRLRELEDENRKLKIVVADLTLDVKMLRDVNSKSGDACRAPPRGSVPGRAIPSERTASEQAAWVVASDDALSNATP